MVFGIFRRYKNYIPSGLKYKKLLLVPKQSLGTSMISGCTVDFGFTGGYSLTMLGIKEKTHTIKDYKLLPEGAPYQLIGGELIITAPEPTPRHQIISANIFERIRRFVKEKGIGIVLYSPIDIYLGEENACQPDIVFISKQRQEIIKEDGIYGPPDLVIEILSPATAYYDIKKKFRVYEKYGVKEYWIVDPEMKGVEVFLLKPNGEFELSSKEKNRQEAK
ncbi:MAG: Uma2 family endonuclease [Deltaproteobacteria bacterium]|nr:Uma2 family endonuclease [Deltaproteobacteria bacterium]